MISRKKWGVKIFAAKMSVWLSHSLLIALYLLKTCSWLLHKFHTTSNELEKSCTWLALDSKWFAHYLQITFKSQSAQNLCMTCTWQNNDLHMTEMFQLHLIDMMLQKSWKADNDDDVDDNRKDEIKRRRVLATLLVI